MPELPEVETVRQGLARRAVGRTIAEVRVHHPRAVRRHLPGADDFVAALRGRTLGAAHRRGKYLWLPLDAPAALVGHLGMSGQLLMRDGDTEPTEPVHLRVRFWFTDGGPPLDFVDQRTFGGLSVSPYDPAVAPVPSQLAHVAADPLERDFDDDAFVAAVRRRRVAVKVALLDQRLISGVGNIYADEALWRARLHGRRPCGRLSVAAVRRLLGHVRDVLREAVAAGGTSFDALYVDVDGAPGWFERSLDAYGREGLPCRRCGAAVARESFTNRSSYFCPRCQPPPRAAPRPRTTTGAPPHTHRVRAGR